MKNKIRIRIYAVIVISLLFSSNLYSQTYSRAWGTYYGGSNRDWSEAMGIDSDGNIIFGGKTESRSGITSDGAYQESYGGDDYDCLLVKFSPEGERLWATYIGGSGNDNITGIVCDEEGNIYITGGSRSTESNVMTSPGAYRESITGDLDAFLMKFDKDGNKVWGTFFGGKELDKGNTIILDHENNIVIAGRTESTDNIATDGAHQATYNGDTDGYIAKFSNSGSLLWGTYYGGTGFDYIFGLGVDSENNILMTGRTQSTAPDNVIASEGALQETFGGGTGQDAFVAKFSPSGSRLWGTYLGGNDNEQGKTVVTDNDNNIYVAGFSKSSSPNNCIATPGSYQGSRAGNTDAFIVKFNPEGERLWGTYYGGSADEFASNITIDDSGYVWLCGQTKSNKPVNSIATAGAYKTSYGGTQDAYFVKFNSSGDRLWGSYYGGEGNDNSQAISVNSEGVVYLTGFTATKTQWEEIASEGAYQTSYAGHNNDAYLVRFDPISEEETAPTDAVILVNPENNFESTETEMEFSWEDNAQAEFYHIMIVGNSDTPVYEDTLVPDDANSIHSLNLDVFEYGVSYVWKVRAGNEYGYGPWSESRVFSIMKTAPETSVVLILPEDMAEDTVTALNFSWQHNEEAEFYHLMINNSLDDVIYNDSLIADKEESEHALELDLFEQGESYTWKMRAGNSGGYGPWSESRSFEVKSPVTVEITSLPGTSFKTYPNPFFENIFIDYYLEKAEHVVIEIIAVNGNRVITLIDDIMPAGDNSAAWSGFDRAGQPVTGGLYIAMIKIGNKVRTELIQVSR